MRAPALVLRLSPLLVLAACGGSTPTNAVEVEENGAMAAENVIDDSDDRAAMLARQAAYLEAQAEQATGARRQELLNQANAAMASAISIQRGGETGAAQIDPNAQRAAQNATGN